MAYLLVGLCVCLCVAVTVGFPSGAPPDTCSYNLAPIHGGHQAHPGPAPYTLTVSASTFSNNKPITVTLKGPSGKLFKGFAIQARDASGEFIANGEWSGSGMKQLPCGAATHTSDVRKSKVELTWTPKGSGDVTFVATVVESFDSFYTDIKSTVRGSSGGSSGSSAASSNRDSNKVRPVATSSLRPSSNDWELDYDSSRPVSSSHKDDEVAASHDQQFSSFYSPHSGFSQPEVGSATNQEEQVGPSYFHQQQNQQQHQQQQQQRPNNFYNYAPSYQGPQGGGGGFNHHHSQAAPSQGNQQHFQEGFANYPAQSEYSQRFAPRPQGGYPYQPNQHQQFRGPWNQYQHQF